MLAKFARNLIAVVVLSAGGCGFCADGHKYAYSSDALSESELRNSTGSSIGTLSSLPRASQLSWKVNSSDIKGSGSLTYSVAAYPSGSACPPEPASKLSDLGTATAAGSDPLFIFDLKGGLQSLDGKVVVLRAQNQAMEPVVGVACTTTLMYIPNMTFEGCSNGS